MTTSPRSCAGRTIEIAEFRAYRQKEIRDLASDTFSIIRSNACFVSEHEVVSEGKRHRFDAAIIATGSVTVCPKIAGLDPAWDGSLDER